MDLTVLRWALLGCGAIYGGGTALLCATTARCSMVQQGADGQVQEDKPLGAFVLPLGKDRNTRPRLNLENSILRVVFTASAFTSCASLKQFSMLFSCPARSTVNGRHAVAATGKAPRWGKPPKLKPFFFEINRHHNKCSSARFSGEGATEQRWIRYVTRFVRAIGQCKNTRLSMELRAGQKQILCPRAMKEALEPGAARNRGCQGQNPSRPKVGVAKLGVAGRGAHMQAP